jgi:hypothetical protein
MGYLGCGTCVDYSVFTPFDSVRLLSLKFLLFADMNKESYFHPFCLIDYSNATSILVCWEGDNIVSLPDLRTEDADVLDTFETWITNLVSTYSIDGLRVDSAQQVDSAFFPPFQTAGECCLLGGINRANRTSRSLHRRRSLQRRSHLHVPIPGIHGRRPELPCLLLDHASLRVDERQYQQSRQRHQRDEV